MTGGRIRVHCNRSAGGGSELEELEQQLGADLVELVVLTPAEITAAAEAAVQRGDALFCVAGGDGTLHGVAVVLAETGTALACVPTGTLNNFARRMGIDSIKAAGAALRARDIRTIPLATVNDDVFLNTLTFGEYARVVRLRERLRRFVGKWPAALLGIFATTLALRQIRLTVTVGDEQLERRTPFLWIGLGWGSFPRVAEAMERRSRPDLEIAIVRPLRGLSAFAFVGRMGTAVLRGRTPIRDQQLDILHCRSLVLNASHRIDGTVDGELLRMQPPVRIAVKDVALRVVVGAGYAEPAP